MRRDGNGRKRKRSIGILVLILLLGLTSCQTGGHAGPSTPLATSTMAGRSAQEARTPSSGSQPATAVATGVTAQNGVATPIVGLASPTTTGSAGVPSFDHIYVIVLENKGTSDVVGSDHAPYLNSLIRQYGLATDYSGVAHPSQPNYLAMWAGSTFGVTDDGIHDLSGATLGDQLDTAGKSWSVYAENYPTTTNAGAAACFTGATASGGEDGSGSYSRKHDPAMSFVDLSGDAASCAQHVTDLRHFAAAATDFALIVPNACHDMHDCPVSTGDSWLSTWLPEHILDTETWKETNSALFITWDEGDDNLGGGGSLPMIVVSRTTPTGFTSPAAHNHYSLLATVEAAWHLGCLRDACQATDLSEFFEGR